MRIVGGVAVGAGGRDHQAALQQALAVDAHRCSSRRCPGSPSRSARPPASPCRWHLRAQLRHVAGVGRRGRQRWSWVSCARRGSRGRSGASGSPCGRQLPCTLSSCCWTCSAWQMQQSTGDRDGRAGRSGVIGETSVWHWAQAVPRAAESVGLLVDEQRDRLAVALHRQLGSAWHFRQSRLAAPCGRRRAAPDLVRLVALDAGRDLVRLLLPQPSLDHLDVHLLDPGVALHAGAGHVVAVDAGIGVVVLEDVVRGVAGGAHRGDGQPLLEEALAVDRHGEVLQDPILRDVVLQGDLGALAVAAAAEQRDVHVDGRRASGFVCDRMAWCRWQVTQRGRRRIPLTAARPCRLARCSAACCSWQTPQTSSCPSGFDGGHHVVAAVAVGTAGAGRCRPCTVTLRDWPAPQLRSVAAAAQLV